jgi:hypothetical protein
MDSNKKKSSNKSSPKSSPKSSSKTLPKSSNKQNSKKNSSSSIFNISSDDNDEMIEHSIENPTLEKFKINYSVGKIQTLLKNKLLRNNYDLDERIKYLKIAKKYLHHINLNNCIYGKVIKDINGKEIEVLNIADIVYLMKQIGTASKYGVIFKSSINNNYAIAPIAAKIMKATKSNANEIKINNILTNILYEKKSRHFIFTYKTFQCVILDNPRAIIQSNNDIHSLLSRSYFVSLNERVDGDIKQLFNNIDILNNDNLLVNIACQCFLAISTFHNLGYLHLDAHWGNFLYKKTEIKNGYYHYILYDTNYYLKDNGYTIMIYDFGKAIKYNQVHIKPLDFIKDYKRISHAFINKSLNGWINYHRLPNISQKIYDFKEWLEKYSNKFTDQKMILNNIYNNFFKRILLTTIPDDAIILNDIPFRVV